MKVKVTPTALIEDGVLLGDGTMVGHHAHVRQPATVGEQCRIGSHAVIGSGVRLGHRCRIGAMAYLCSGVTLEDGVMIGQGAVFTNDLHPRAATPDLRHLLTEGESPEHPLPTLVCQGATIGANSTIRGGVTIGRFAMVGMGTVVTRDVAAFHLVSGNPARSVGYVCRCGHTIHRFTAAARSVVPEVPCPACSLKYALSGDTVLELSTP